MILVLLCVLNFFVGLYQKRWEVVQVYSPEFVEKWGNWIFGRVGRREPEPGFSDQGLESPFRPC